jgi:anti-sigma B factor antagonist
MEALMVPKNERGMGSGMLEVRRARDGGRRIVCLCGELDLSNAEQAEREIEAALAGDGSEVVIDMRELSFIDSTGIALLVGAMRREDAASRLRFVPSPFQSVRRVIQITGLEQRMPTLDGPAPGYPRGHLESTGEGPLESTGEDPVPAS